MLEQISRYFGRQQIPSHFRQKTVHELQYLSIDLELTDLKTEVAEITSIGWVSTTGFSFNMADAFYSIVNYAGDLKQSPAIHGLVAKNLAFGNELSEVLERLIDFTQTHVWIVHNSALDIPVIRRHWQALEFPSCRITVIDTMQIALYLQLKDQHYHQQANVTLEHCCQKMGLPDGDMHDALADATAALLLWYAQITHWDQPGELRLNDLRHTGAIKTFTLGK